MRSALSFRPFLKRLHRYVIEWLRYLGPNFKWEWAVFVPPLFILFVISCLKGTEPAYRIGGGVLQIIGVASVFWGVRQTRSSFGQIGGWQSFISRVKNRPTWNPKVISMSAGMASGHSSMSAILTIGRGFPADGSVNDKLEMLLTWLNETMIDVDKVRGALDQAKNDLAKQISNEKSERDRADHKLLKTMEGVSTGGLSLTVAATVWIMVGLVLSTFSIELAGYYITIL